MRKSRCYPTHKKERALGLMSVKQIKHPLGISHNPGWPGIPALTRHLARKRLHLKIVLDVHAEDMGQRSLGGITLPCRIGNAIRFLQFSSISAGLSRQTELSRHLVLQQDCR